MDRITIARPDDWHLHLRDGDAMRAVLPHTTRCFGRAVVMPNLRPPVTTVSEAMAYRERILDASPAGDAFTPLMALYLTEHTPPDEVVRAARSEHVIGFKLYPAGATTNSEAGLRRLDPVYPVLEAMEQLSVPLLVHGEDPDPEVDPFDREPRFIDKTLAPLLARFPRLRVVLEHITTADAVAFVRGEAGRMGATITAHHLLLNRGALFAGGLRPHAYCLPLLKRERDRQALLDAGVSGEPTFFLGTDSAPHPRDAKEAACGCAGIFSAPAAIELYAEAFALAGALDRLEGFASRFGAEFYGLPASADTITLERRAWTVPAAYPMGAAEVVPLRAGETVAWSLV